MEETALRYEYIIRAAHKVGRLGIIAARADIYRGLETRFTRHRDNKDAAKNEELLFKYAFYCGEITTNLNNALWQFEKDFDQQLTDKDKEELNDIETALIDAKMEEIDASIELIENVFRRHGILA